MNEIQIEKELEGRAIYTNSEGNPFPLNKEVPVNHKWFKGEFHGGAWGGDSSPFKGESKDRVKVAILGSRRIKPTINNGMASVYGVVTAVVNTEDRDLIGQFGWWKLEDRSRTTVAQRRINHG